LKIRSKLSIRGDALKRVNDSFEDGMSIDQHRVQDQLEEQIGHKNRTMSKYAKLISELGSLKVQVGKPETFEGFNQQRSPLHVVTNPDYDHINVKNLFHEVIL